MRIFVIGARGFPDVEGGIEKHCEGLYPGLVDKGCIITALTIKGYGERDSWKGINFIKIPAPHLKNLEKPSYNFFAAVYSFFKRPDIIHVHGLNAGFFIWFFKLFRIKIVATYHSMDYIYPKWNKYVKIMLRFSEMQFLSADYIITVSKGYLQHFYNKGRTRFISYLPNGIHLEGLANYVDDQLLEKWGLRKGEFVLYVGRITPEKDLATLIEAFNKINLPSLKLVIAGSASFKKDEYLESLKKISSKDIFFLGQLNKKELSVLYSNCALFVIPSIYEGLPNALLEAMSFKCRILASNIDAHKEIGLDEKDYFNVQDSKDLADKIKQKTTDNIKRNYLEIIVKNYNWDNIAQSTYKIYKSLSI